MAFMIPVAEHMTVYSVETTAGSCIVPADLVSLPEGVDEAEGGTCELVRDGGELTEDDLAVFRDYVEGNPTGPVYVWTGWFARLSAPGYLDATEWDGPHATEEEALAAVKEFYEVDDNGDLLRSKRTQREHI